MYLLLTLGGILQQFLSSDGKERLFSEPQVHDFNFPFQLGSGTEFSRCVLSRFCNPLCNPPPGQILITFHCSPEDGDLWTHTARPKDFLLLFTDGISGNLHANEIAEVSFSPPSSDMPSRGMVVVQMMVD